MSSVSELLRQHEASRKKPKPKVIQDEKETKAVKMLNELRNAKHREVWDKLTPHQQWNPNPINSKSANGLTKCIIEYIKLRHGGQAERINTQGTYDAKLKRYRATQGTKGSADISAIVYGKSLKIEVKYGKDRMSPDQEKYGQAVTNAGGIYIVARSFYDFLIQFNELINPQSKQV
jgi:hypothetical protein